MTMRNCRSRRFSVNCSEQELAEMIFELGGERFSRRIAKAIKERERKKPITTSGELAEIVRTHVPQDTSGEG